MTRKASSFLVYHANLDLAFTYALSRPRLAMECALDALYAADDMGRPDLAYVARNLIMDLGA